MDRKRMREMKFREEAENAPKYNLGARKFPAAYGGVIE
jgi:hypothetical protein